MYYQFLIKSLVLVTSRKTQKTCSLSQVPPLIARGVGVMKARVSSSLSTAMGRGAKGSQ